MTEQLIAEWTTEDGIAATVTGSGPLAEAMCEQVRREDTGSFGDHRFPIPSNEWFDGADYRRADSIRQVAEGLIEREGRFAHLRDQRIDYLWKRKAGTKGGKEILGKAQSVAGLTNFYAEVDFAIVIGADTCRKRRPTRRQMEALVFHELCHLDFEVDEETGVVTVKLVEHDFTGFIDELAAYGLWHTDLQEVRDAFRQAALPLFDDEAAS